MTKIRYMLYLPFVLCLLFATDDISAQSLESSNWYKQYSSIKCSESVHFLLQNSLLRFPATKINDGTLVNQVVIIGEDNKEIGWIWIDDNWSELLSVELTPIYEENAGSISVDEAENIAVKFINQCQIIDGKSYEIQRPKSLNDMGRYKIMFKKNIEDITMKKVVVEIDSIGRVVGVTIGTDLTDQFKINIKEIPSSPGKIMVLNAMVKYLSDKNISRYTLDGLHRTFAIQNNKITNTCWQANITILDNSDTAIAEIWYNESEKMCKLSDWNHYPKSSNYISSNIHPVWGPDNNTIYWQTRSRWKRLPDWVVMPPESIGVASDYNSIPYIYRPLPDIDILKISYTLPSVSSDGRWLLFRTDENNETAIDTKESSLYIIPNIQKSKNRPSWCSDGSKFAIIDTEGEYLTIQTVQNESRNPFEAKPIYIHLTNRCIAAEFIPKSKNTLIALLKGNKLIRIFIREDKTIVVEDIYELQTKTFQMHIMPDGEKVIVADEKGCKMIDLNTKMIAEIKWLKDGNKLSDNLIINTRIFDWDISPNGKRIAFSAICMKGEYKSIGLYTANIDGGQCKQISAIDQLVKLDRFQLNGKYSIIPKDHISISTLEKLGFTNKVAWPVPSPAKILPWERTTSQK